MSLSLLALMAASCSSTARSSQNAADSVANNQQLPSVRFNADSAYSFVEAQCAFGPRVPGTAAHSRCGDYLVSQLKRFGANVTEQKAKLKAFDGTALDMRNIIATINPDAQKRILLLAHWDCRPWADNDSDPANHSQPVMGANDGASGVGVLLEICRSLQSSPATVGVDIILVDDEDWGNHNGDEESWALGTQYWTKNMHEPGYRPAFGILLDMVGAKGATFYQEYYSTTYAQSVVTEVWNIAQRLGYGAMFRNSRGGGITDDHVFLCRAGIPCIDIIDMRLDSDNGFFEHWHTTTDTMQNIDPATLKAVGTVVLTLIHSM